METYEQTIANHQHIIEALSALVGFIITILVKNDNE